MGNQSFYLFQLQKIDRRLDQINNRISQIDSLVAHDQALADVQSDFNSSVRELNDINDHLATIEKRSAEKRVKIEISESSLYGGKVHNPKELSDLQLEIASLKSALQKLENDQIELMVASEEHQSLVDKKNTLLELAMSKNHSENENLYHEKNDLLNEISRTGTERSAITQQIKPEILSQYESLKKLKRGIAVAGIEEQCCTICGSQLTPAECQMAKSSTQITFCPSCGRILYAD